MNEWTGGYGGKRPAGAKIPVRVHRNVAIVLTADAPLAEELANKPKVARHIVGRLGPNALLVEPGKAADVVEELRKLGQTPKVVEAP